MHRLFFFLLMALPFFLQAQLYPSRPLNYVTDDAGVLSPAEEEALNHTLKRFEDSSSNQVFIYIAASLNGKNLESFSQELFQHWEVGHQNKDNGVLLTVFVNDHQFRIQTGYGLESVLPDLLTKKIQDEDMAPSFKRNDFYEGLDKGVSQLMFYSSHAYIPEPRPLFSPDTIKRLAIAYAFNLFLLITFLYDIFKKSAAPKRSTSGKFILCISSVIAFCIPLFGTVGLIILHYIVTDKTPGKTYGASGGSYRSSGSSGFSSGSGFGGGGGGRSGGGGSSSSW